MQKESSIKFPVDLISSNQHKKANHQKEHTLNYSNTEATVTK